MTLLCGSPIIAYDQEDRRALVATEYGASVYVLDALSPPSARVVVRLSRYESDRGMRHLQLHRVPEGVLICYEAGLALIEGISSLVWHVEHGRIDWTFDQLQDGVIWFEAQDGKKIGYGLKDGYTHESAMTAGATAPASHPISFSEPTLGGRPGPGCRSPTLWTHLP